MFKEKAINSLKVVPVQSGVGKWDKTNCKGYDIHQMVRTGICLSVLVRNLEKAL